MVVKTFNEMVSDALRYLVQHSSITYTMPGSTSRALIEAMALQLSDVQSRVSYLMDQLQIDTAAGTYLDNLGKMFSLPRLTDVPAMVAAEDKNIKFYVTSGTVYGKLGGTSDTATIPQGTRIYTSDRSYIFATTSDIIVNRTATQVYASAISVSLENQGNIGKAKLTYHDLNNSEILVTNDLQIASGSSVETDEEYRFRLKNAFNALGGGNTSAVTLATFGHPGVSDFKILNHARGAGTFDVLVVPRSNRLGADAKQDIYNAISSVAALGISHAVREPEYTTFSVVARLLFDTDIDESERVIDRIAAESAIIQYLSEIPMGGLFVPNRMISRMLTATSKAKDVAIDEVLIDDRPMAIREFKLDDDAIFVISETVPDPILVG